MLILALVLALGAPDEGSLGECRGRGSEASLSGEPPSRGEGGNRAGPAQVPGGEELPRLAWDDETPPLPTPPEADAWEMTVRIAPLYRWVRGHVRVRENETEGTTLDFTRDLSLVRQAGGHLEVEAEKPHVRWLVELEEDFGWGGRTTETTTFWNGTRFPPPAQARDHSQFLTVRATVSGKWLRSEEGSAWMGPVAGVEYPFYTVTFHTNLTRGSLEDWVHYLPYPVVGAAGRVPLAPGVFAEARLTGGYLPNVPSPFIEGGRLYVSARPSIALEAPIAWEITPSLELSFWVGYQYWFGRDHSVEDGNSLVFSSVGLMLGLGYRW